MHHGSLPSVKSESKRTQMMVLQTASGTCRQNIALKGGSIPLAVGRMCHSARIRRIRTFSTSVECQKCPFNRHFYEIRAVFAQNVGTKLVLNCEIIINDARFLL